MQAVHDLRERVRERERERWVPMDLYGDSCAYIHVENSATLYIGQCSSATVFLNDEYNMIV